MREISGRAIILGSVALAVAMAVVAWVHQYRATHRAAAFWGAAAAEQLLHARQVTAFALGDPVGPSSAGPTAAGRVILWQRDVSEAPGLVHFRHALTQDRNFRWPIRPDLQNAHPPWVLAFQFGGQDDPNAVRVVFTRDCRVLGLVDDRGAARPADSSPMAGVLTKYLADVGLSDVDRAEKSGPPSTSGP